MYFFFPCSDADTPDKASVTTTAVEGKGKVNGATATSAGSDNRMLPLRHGGAKQKEGKGFMAIFRSSRQAVICRRRRRRKVNSPCGKLQGEKDTMI